MSRTLYDLKQTKFKGYQNHQVISPTTRKSHKRGSSLAKALLFILVPSLMVGAVLSYQSYQQQNLHLVSQALNTGAQGSENQSGFEAQMGEASKLAVSKVSEAPTLFSIRTAPAGHSLKVLPRKDMYAQVETGQDSMVDDLNMMSSSAGHSIKMERHSEPSPTQRPIKPEVKKESSALQSDSDLLKGLDLTELPPDLALKLESMMGEQPVSPEPMDSRPVGSMDSQVIGLETHGNRLSGVLPKLDLQTHMYSSSETKRWVKVNGHEVAQGEWIERGIQLLEIKPQSIIIEFNQQKIEIPALYEWKG